MGLSVAMDGAFAIEAQHLVKNFPGRLRALDGVTFGVAVGGLAAVLGPPGAGKSTVLDILSGRLRPDGGRTWVAGHEVGTASGSAHHRVGYVGQRSGADPEVGARENLLLVGRAHGLPGPRLHGRVEELLVRFGLADVAGTAAHRYPGGLRRKLDLACGLVHDPSVLLVDEPTAGLDLQTRIDLWVEIGRLVREEGRTVLFATQDPADVEHLACELVVLDRGRVVASGESGESVPPDRTGPQRLRSTARPGHRPGAAQPWYGGLWTGSKVPPGSDDHRGGKQTVGPVAVPDRGSVGPGRRPGRTTPRGPPPAPRACCPTAAAREPARLRSPPPTDRDHLPPPKR